MPIPAYGDVGKAVKDLLQGSPKSGAFQLDHKATYSGTTSSGVAFTLTAVKKGDKIDPTLKAAYSKKGYSADATYDGSSKITVNTTVSDLLIPNLKASGSVVLPDPNTAKLGLEYTFPYLTTKATVALTSKPAVDVVASTGVKDFVVGVECGYDTAKNGFTKYNCAVGYHAPDHQIAVSVLDKLQTVKVGYAHNVNKTTKVGAEVVRKLASGDTTINLGYQRSLASGALAKFKIDNTGLLSALYETKLNSGEKVAGAIQLQATDLSKPPKYGFAIDLA